MNPDVVEDRGAWRAAVHGLTKNRTQVSGTAEQYIKKKKKKNLLKSVLPIVFLSSQYKQVSKLDHILP